jgi:hypothetical protein
MSGSTSNDEELFAEGWAALVRYPAMLAGTMAGQLVGIAIDAVTGNRGFLIPILCSAVCEAIAGVRFAGPRGGKMVDASAAPRVSATYSLALAGLSLPLIFWVAVSHAEAVEGGVGYSFLTPARIAGALVALVAATAARAGLMMAIVKRSG